ncbi:hypothetical protein, partial [Burkholderia thailandensis]|uniref:hypothetical protein n=1 Tax=Burkholderia thailandensis TaxID=57975 RepID=UPI001E425656
PPDIHKIRRQVTQSFSKAPRFSAMNLFYARAARDAVGAAHRPSPDRMRRACRFRTHEARARAVTP